MVHTSQQNNGDSPPKNRLIFGGIVFITGFLSPLLIPLVIASDLPSVWKTGISGVLAVGIPELFMIIAAAILGKTGFNYLKNKLSGYLKRYGPPDTVGPGRYRIGLICFSLPLLAGLLLPYIWEMIPFIEENLFWINITGDVILLSSLFILGGDFWDKLRSLFVYKSRAVLIKDQPRKPNSND